MAKSNKTITYHKININAEDSVDRIKQAIEEHHLIHGEVNEVWCSKKDRLEPFSIDDLTIIPKGGCRKGEIMIL